MASWISRWPGWSRALATTIAGITVKVVEFRRLPDEHGGGPRRTISGSLRGDVLWTKRAWEATVYATNATEADTLRAALGPTTPVNVAGDLFHGATVSCIAEVMSASYQRIPNNPTGFYLLMDLSIREA